MSVQMNLFQEPSHLPVGFRHKADFLSPEDEARLVSIIEALPFRQFEFQGFLGKRRVVSFGWKYDFNDRALRRADDILEFLLPVRERAARFAKLPPSVFQQVLLTEYQPGASIGWHKDKPVFDEVIGISLLSPCVFRFRRQKGPAWKRASLTMEPRSIYMLAGASRSE